MKNLRGKVGCEEANERTCQSVRYIMECPHIGLVQPLDMFLTSSNAGKRHLRAAYAETTDRRHSDDENDEDGDDTALHRRALTLFS